MPLHLGVPLRASIGLAGALVVGCSGPVADDVADASGTMTEGVVLVERTVAGDGAPQTHVSAKFMRLGAPVDPDLAERVVGAKLDLPPLGTCRPSSTTVDDSAGRSAIGNIELIDVGNVDLLVPAGAASSPVSRLPLAVRAFPDVGDLVSGMFYTSLDAASDLPAGAPYVLEGTGSGQVERFAVDAEAPAALEDVRVGGAPLVDDHPGTRALGEPLSVEEAPLSVRWRGADRPQAGDVIVIEVSGPNGSAVRCSFPDQGQGVLPAWTLRASTLGAATGTLAVHRVRGRSFVAAGIDSGEVRFDLSVMGRIVVASPGAAPPGAAPPGAASPAAASPGAADRLGSASPGAPSVRAP